MVLETKRCNLTIIERKDFEDIRELYLNETVRKYLGGVKNNESIEKSLHNMYTSYNDSYYWVVREKVTHHFLGLISLELHHDGIHFEVAYQFLPKYWGMGYATEVIKTIIEFSFSTLHLSKVVAETQVANVLSCKLLNRIGMKLEKKITRFGEEQAFYSITPTYTQ